MHRLLPLLLFGLLLVPASASATVKPCTTTVSSAASAQSAVGAAAPGAVVCLADGTYGRMSLDYVKAAPGVTLQAANSGGATVAGISLHGRNLTVSQLVFTGEVSILNGAAGMTIDHNKMLGTANSGNYGVFVCNATPPDHCDDISITGNHFIGAFDEDVIRANVYHDGNGDGNGLLIEGNEFEGNYEYGGHNDVFQSVWVGDHLTFRKNYLHDFGGQGFFVKDQGSAIDGLIADDNLIVRQDLPCNPTSLCPTWQLSPFQVYGPIANVSMQHNTVGFNASGPDGGQAVLTGSYTNVTFSHNVFSALSMTNGGGSVPTGITGADNTACTSSNWPWPPGTTTDCSPAFLDRSSNDYRQAGGRGVDWRPADQVYGPESGSPPPPPPTPQCADGVDNDGDGLIDLADPGCANASDNDETNVPPPPPPDNQPVARFTWSPTSPRRGQQVTFDARTSTCQDTPCTYAWQDDGSDGPAAPNWPLGTGSVLQFTFSGAGTKYVRVTVTDVDGDSSSVKHNVTVR